MTVLWGSIQATNGKIDRDELVRGQKDEAGMAKAIEGAAGAEKQIPYGNDNQKKKQEQPKLERLQKILAAAGVASRRKAEEIILAGRVQVNGTTISELGTKHDPARDHIRVDGKLRSEERRVGKE